MFLILVPFEQLYPQTGTGVLYPRTPYGQSIETMYIDSTSNTLYIGGDFTSLELPPSYTGSANRNRIAAIDLKTGNLLPWVQSIDDGVVHCIEMAGDTIYVGGSFNSVNSQPLRNLVALDKNSSNSNYSIFNTFIPNDIIYSLFIKQNSIYAGGYINNYNNTPTTHLIEINRMNGSLIYSFSNLFNSDYWENVFKISIVNNRLYLIAETFLSSSSVDKSIYSFNLSSPAASTLLLSPSYSFPTWPKPEIDDFFILNNRLYLIGNFNQLMDNNTTVTRNKIGCYNLSASSFETWAPVVSSNGFLQSLNNVYGKKNSHIIPFHDWTFYSEQYSTTINSEAGVNGSSSNYTDITGAPALISSTPLGGNFFFDIRIAKGYVVLLNREIGNSVARNNIFTYCLQIGTPDLPISTTNTSTFCRGTSYSFYVPNANHYSLLNWSYTGNGASISGNGNDTVTLTFAINTTPGNLYLSGTDMCGQTGSSVSIPINFHPLPNVNAGKDTTLTCANNKQIILTGTSSVSNNTLMWYNPLNIPFQNNSLISLPGTYILHVTDNTSGCKNFDTLLVTYDTISPTLTVNSSYLVTSCNPQYIQVNATSGNAADTIFWNQTGTSTNFANPANLYGNNTYLAIATGTNGCSDSSLVTVTNGFSYPTILIPTNTPTGNIGGISAYLWDSISCTKDSILLNFISSVGSVKVGIVRPTPYSDSVSNNCYVKYIGLYKINIVDTITGCIKNEWVYIGNNTTVPHLALPTNNPMLTCSNATTFLDGASLTPNSILTWTGPGTFSSPDPATVNQTGNYVLTVINPANGCIKKDSITITQQNILILNSSNDTMLCKGDSITIGSSAVGGTPLFTYVWNNSLNNTSSLTVTPNNTTQYIITITDAANCIGTDSITVTIPPPITDSTFSVAPCDPQNPNGQIQIFASGGVPPYQYAMNNGLFQTNTIFSNLNFGNYTITIQDSLNCTHSFVASISNQSQMPVADFIVSTTMMKADTFVVVDISNPRPDSVFWTFPSTVTVINNNMFAPVIVSSDTGIVSVTMQAHFGSCISSLTKQVQFIKPDTASASPNGKGIESITIFPNPNSGQFSVEVKLYKKQTFAIYIFNAQGVEQKRVSFSEIDYGLNAFTLPNPTPGTYVVKVIAEFDSKSKIFSVTQ